MDQLYIAAIGAAIYGVIREIGGQIVAVKKASNEVEAQENEAYKKRTDALITELRADYEAQILKTDAAMKIANEALASQHQCEKDKIRLEGKVDLVTWL